MSPGFNFCTESSHSTKNGFFRSWGEAVWAKKSKKRTRTPQKTFRFSIRHSYNSLKSLSMDYSLALASQMLAKVRGKILLSSPDHPPSSGDSIADIFDLPIHWVRGE